MLLLGIDLGTSSVKATVIDAASQKILASATYPDSEAEIISLKPGWAEQDPDTWWTYVQKAILKCNTKQKYDSKAIKSIGISYQMHGLVLVDKNKNVLRNAIIWCDSRAVDIGNKAFEKIGKEYCLPCLLNSPGNFTASKLAWIKEHEPDIYAQVDKIMLPGDFIAMKLTGEISTSISALSEAVLWDFKKDTLSEEVMQYYGFDKNLIPTIQSVFSIHGMLKKEMAERLSLAEDAVVAYKAGDQPNNALSLNVLQAGEVAATAGTSGVIYAVSDKVTYDEQSRINSFAHVNYKPEDKKIGILLCLNGTGIFYKWLRNIVAQKISYEEMNQLAQDVEAGSKGLLALPFGNGSERILNNQFLGGQFHGIDFNLHTTAHLVRATLEGIAFSFRYGLDIMRLNGISPQVVKTGKANMFLSNVFAQTFADINNVVVEFYEGDGSYGAAIGAGIGSGYYKNASEGSLNRKSISKIEPNTSSILNKSYEKWATIIQEQLHQ